MLQAQHSEQTGLSSDSTRDPTSGEICDIFFEAFCLFPTSEPVDISTSHRDTEVHEDFVGSNSRSVDTTL